MIQVGSNINLRGDNMPDNDKYVLILVIIIILIWLMIAFKRWLYAPRIINLPFLPDDNKKLPSTEAVDFLESQGYDVLYGKHKVPIYMIIDDKEDKPLQSQYFIDYFARKDEMIYIVKLAKARQSIPWTGSSIRDHFLPLFLIYEEVSGVLYVDMNLRKIKKIVFTLDEYEIIGGNDERAKTNKN